MQRIPDHPLWLHWLQRLGSVEEQKRYIREFHDDTIQGALTEPPEVATALRESLLTMEVIRSTEDSPEGEEPMRVASAADQVESFLVRDHPALIHLCSAAGMAVSMRARGYNLSQIVERDTPTHAFRETFAVAEREFVNGIKLCLGVA